MTPARIAVLGYVAFAAWIIYHWFFCEVCREPIEGDARHELVSTIGLLGSH